MKYREYEQVFIKIGGNSYFGYKGYVFANGDYYLKRYCEPGLIITNRSVTDMFTEDHIDAYLDDNFVLKSGDPIHVVPDCKYAINDLRNNYQIKRSFDAGVCNVFSPLKYPAIAMWIQRVAIIKRYNAICFFADRDNMYITDAIREMHKVFPDLTIADVLLLDHQDCNSIICTKKLKNYLPLLLNTAKNPCVSYKKLEFNTNELTSDVLMLVKKCGSVDRYSPDAEKNFLIQLAVLNQHNWRDYPRTIMNMFSTIGYGTIKDEVFSHPSKYPKYVNEMYDMSRASRPKYTEKDFNLSREFYANVLELKSDTMFVDTLALQYKLNNVGISLCDFEQI